MTKHSQKVPKSMHSKFESIVELTDKCSDKFLNQEYKLYARYLTAALCRKKSSPLTKGQVSSWACGIIYAIGFVNFLFDKNNEPYLSATDLCNEFNISKSTASAKATEIKRLFKMHQLSPQWCIPSIIEKNPLFQMVSSDMFIEDTDDIVFAESPKDRNDRIKCITEKLEEVLLAEGEFSKELLEYDLEPELGYFKESHLRDNEDCLLVVDWNFKKNYQNSDVAMLFIDKKQQIHTNEEAKKQLNYLWKHNYHKNIKTLIPIMSEDVCNNAFCEIGISIIDTANQKYKTI